MKLSKHIKVNSADKFKAELTTICEGVVSNKSEMSDKSDKSDKKEKTFVNESVKNRVEDTVGSHKRFF
jgi:hypothetical protein